MPPNDPGSPDLPAQFSGEQIFAIVAPSVCLLSVGIGSTGQSGTGFLAKTASMGDGGARTLYIATAYHVVKPFIDYAGTRISIRFYHDDQDVYENTAGKEEITLCGYDIYHDVAVLKVADKVMQKERRGILSAADASGAVSYSFAINESPAAGCGLFALGSMGGGGIQIFDGIMSDPDKTLEFDGLSVTDPLRFRPVYQVTVDINAGVSGGPVFDRAGKLAGIAAYQMPLDEQRRPVLGVSFAVPAVIAAPLIEKAIMADDGGEIHKINMYMTAPDELNLAELGFYLTRTERMGFRDGAASGYPAPSFSYTVSRLVVPGAPPLDLADGWFTEGDILRSVAYQSVDRLAWAQIFGLLCRFANESNPSGVPEGLKSHYSGEYLTFMTWQKPGDAGSTVYEVTYMNKIELSLP